MALVSQVIPSMLPGSPPVTAQVDFQAASVTVNNNTNQYLQILSAPGQPIVDPYRSNATYFAGSAPYQVMFVNSPQGTDLVPPPIIAGETATLVWTDTVLPPNSGTSIFTPGTPEVLVKKIPLTVSVLPVSFTVPNIPVTAQGEFIIVANSAAFAAVTMTVADRAGDIIWFKDKVPADAVPLQTHPAIDPEIVITLSSVPVASTLYVTATMGSSIVSPSSTTVNVPGTFAVTVLGQPLSIFGDITKSFFIPRPLVDRFPIVWDGNIGAGATVNVYTNARPFYLLAGEITTSGTHAAAIIVQDGSTEIKAFLTPGNYSSPFDLEAYRINGGGTLRLHNRSAFVINVCANFGVNQT